MSETKTKISAAAALVKCLEAENITTIFGYPGAAICPFYDKLYASDIKHILVRHEANAGHAASGYARVTGKPAVCVATSGPGATNLITAIATAYMDSIPMVIITGQVNSDQIGRDVFQEADITGATEPFVKHSYLIKDADKLPLLVKNAFHIAGSGRPGPVLLDIPVDVLTSEIDSYYPENVNIRSYKPSYQGNKLQIKRVIEALSEAKKPLICAGGGLFSAGACDLFKKFIENAGIPVISTLMGISVLSSEHPLYFGMLGIHGCKTANTALFQCDLLFLMGARVGDRAITALSALENSKKLKIIHIDIDPAEIGKNLKAAIPVVGDLKAVLGQIPEDFIKTKNCDKNYSEWLDILNQKKQEELDYSGSCPDLFSDAKFVKPKFFIDILSRKLPENCVIVADVGQNQIWTASGIKLKSGRFMTSGGMGTMGYSIPAAIGAKCASPKAEVVAICGDGSFQMQFMELATMVQHDINVKIIVMSNNRLGMVRELQTNLYDNRLMAVQLDGSPDFIKIAEAYGIKGERVISNKDAENAIDRLIKSEKPYLLQIQVEENEKTI